MGVPAKIIKPPMTWTIFPVLMIMGVMILIVSPTIAIFVATITYGYRNHSITTAFNPAVAGSQLLGGLLSISTVNASLALFKFVRIGSILTCIGLAMATIIRVLRWQS